MHILKIKQNVVVLSVKTSVPDYVNYFIQKHKGLNNHLVNTK